MRTFTRTPGLALWALLAVALTLSGTALARKPLPKKITRLIVPVTKSPKGKARRGVPTGARGYGITAFKLRWAGDHKLRRIGVGLQRNRFTAELGDNDGNDAFFYNAMYTYAHTARVHTVSRRGCRRSCKIRYPKEAGKVFVLNGFALNRHGGDDNVLEMAVMPNQMRGEITVTLRDNSGKRPFDARVSYVMVPDRDVYAQKRIKKHSAGRRLKLDLSSPPRGRSRGRRGQHRPISSERVLQGFHVRFKNGDHHLGALEIDLELGWLRFEDKRPDDPYSADLMYALINDASRPDYR
jgi:hypothetical protein